LVGQSILDGHLPYTKLWELKPPLAFAFYALAILCFGKSIAAVRFAGVLWVACTAFLVNITGEVLWNRRTGIITAIIFILLSALLPSGQSVMSEHVALLPLTAALSLLITKKTTPRNLFWAGALMAIASMIRLNLAYVALLVGCFALFVKPVKSIRLILLRGFAYAAGGVVIIFSTFIPYLISNHQQLWWSSVIVASLQRANTKLSVLAVFKGQLGNITWLFLQPHLFGIFSLFWIGAIAGLVLLAMRWNKISESQKLGWLFWAIFLLSTEISILKSGAAHEHYFIQLIPFLALPAGLFLDTILFRHSNWLVISVVSLIFLIAIKPILHQYYEIASRALGGQPLDNSAAFEIATYFKQNAVDGEPIYMMDDHIVYWLVDSQPLSKSTTHPSTIGKEYLLKILLGPDGSSKSEMTRILSKEPEFIVKKEEVWYLQDDDVKQLLQETLLTKYEFVHEVQGRQIYRRLQIN
jgi:4-amino-4-deoxy-L-arabinose transferase-like glycosyltransferase